MYVYAEKADEPGNWIFFTMKSETILISLTFFKSST